MKRRHRLVKERISDKVLCQAAINNFNSDHNFKRYVRFVHQVYLKWISNRNVKNQIFITPGFASEVDVINHPGIINYIRFTKGKSYI